MLDLSSLLIHPITYWKKKKVTDIFLNGKVIVGFKNISKLQKTLPHFKNKSLRLYWDACGISDLHMSSVVLRGFR